MRAADRGRPRASTQFGRDAGTGQQRLSHDASLIVGVGRDLRPAQLALLYRLCEMPILLSLMLPHIIMNTWLNRRGALSVEVLWE